MAIVESLEMRKRLRCGSMERELHISRKVSQEFLKTPKTLMERLTKWKNFNCFLSSVRRGAYLVLSLFELETRLVSKPTVSSKTLRQLLLISSSKPSCISLQL